MPSLKKTLGDTPRFIGVDGCKAGWVAARLAQGGVEARLFETFAALLASPFGKGGIVAVDMPIGLADEGRRACDSLARKALGRRRASSIFPPPRRFILAAPDYETANALGKAQGPDGGGGLSKQAWNILPKIREVDAALSARKQARIFEAHPELAFLRLAGEVLPPKKTAEGLAARRRTLARHGLKNLDDAWTKAKAPGLGEDDVLDAAALALTAQARADGKALRYSDDGRDGRGLVMEIWG